MSIDNQSLQDSKTTRSNRTLCKILWCGIGYSAVSTLTLPFLNSLWLGELPVLGLFQLPKLPLAHWIRVHVVMEVINRLGLSSGSFSPDYGMARPYALMITYLIPVVVVLALGWRRIRPVNRKPGSLVIVYLIATAIDFVATLLLAGNRNVSMY